MKVVKWLRFVIAGALLAVVIPASAVAYPTMDDGFGSGNLKERPSASSACTDNPRLWRLDPTICSDTQPVTGGGQEQPASDPISTISRGSEIQTEWIVAALAVLLAGGALIVATKRRPHALG